MSQCTATAKSTGERCQRPAIKGGTVCYQHGGAAPQVQKKAQERGFEAQPLASIATDWHGNIERSSIAYYYGPELIPGINWLSKYQLHIRPFGQDGELIITGHVEKNPWNPVYALPHFLGIGLTPDAERAKEVLELE